MPDTTPTPPLPVEPPDGTALYWPESDGGISRAVVRDDEAARRYFGTDDPGAVFEGYRWFRPNGEGEPWVWADAVAAVREAGLEMSAAVVLRPVPKEG